MEFVFYHRAQRYRTLTMFIWQPIIYEYVRKQ